MSAARITPAGILDARFMPFSSFKDARQRSFYSKCLDQSKNPNGVGVPVDREIL